MAFNIIINSLPFSGGSPITDIEYRVNGGSAVSLGTNVVGTYPITAVSDDDIEIRAVNSIGNGPWSVAKVLTLPTGPVLTGPLSVDETTTTGAASFSVDQPCRVYWAVFPSDTVSATPSVAGPIIAAGTGALDNGFFDVASGVSVNGAIFADGLSDSTSTLYVIARNESVEPISSWSNILKDTTVSVNTVGSSVITPVLKGVSLSGTNTDSPSFSPTFPSHVVGDLLEIDVYFDQSAAVSNPVTMSASAGTVVEEIALFDDGNATGNGHAGKKFRIIAASNSTTGTITLGGELDQFSVVIKAWQAGTFNPTVPIVDKNTTFSTAGAGAATTAAFTPSVGGGVVSFSAARAFDPFSASPPTGWVINGSPTDLGALPFVAATRTDVTVFDDPIASVNFSGTNSHPFVAMTCVINPAVA